MNLANLITLSRLVVTIGVIVCLEVIGNPQEADTTLAWMAFGLFLVAAVTDAVDGYVARHMGQVTRFGRVIDPFADKVLICGTLISLLRFAAVAEVLFTWMVVVIVAREFLVTTIRGLAESSGMKFPADRLGKLKMVAQCVAASALLTMVAGTEIFYWFAQAGIWITLALTLVSGGSYLCKARFLLFEVEP